MMNTVRHANTNFTSGSWKKIGLPLLLIAAILFTYRHVFNFGFLHYDTPMYVTENAKVMKGISFKNIQWALATTFFSNWHPLTWISHMLDVSVWGANPAGHHATSLLLHILNSLLIFTLLEKTTTKFWESFILAALFALHPLHIESVVWIAERKDVLSTFFFLLSLHCYVNFIHAQTVVRYSLILLVFTMALMSKPMVVTLPCVLLLLDYWPLNRCFLNYTATTEFPRSQITNNATLSVVLEKIPFFLIASIGCWITFIAQKINETDLKTLPIYVRLANASNSYLEYIIKTFWPIELAVIYPFQGIPPSRNIIISLILITAVSFLCIRWRQGKPWLLTGWLWFLGTLVPVIGLVQVGQQSMADRYTYIPSIGLNIMIIWGCSNIAQKYHLNKKVITFISIFSILACSVATQYQLRYWINDFTLFNRALTITKDNYVAETNLGYYYLRKHNLDEAEQHFCRAIQINPKFPIAYVNLGRVYSLKGKDKEAIDNYQMAIKFAPNSIEISFFSYLGQADALEKLGSPLEAIFYYQKALEVNPKSIHADINIGKILVKLNKPDQALSYFRQALTLDPSNISVREEIDELQRTQSH